MLNKYPLWKYLLILAVLAVGFIYSAPNLYPDDPAVQISGASTALQVTQADVDKAACRCRHRRQGRLAGQEQRPDPPGQAGRPAAGQGHRPPRAG